MLLDTGATKTIVRPDLVRQKKLQSSKLRLKTATGDQALVLGELTVDIGIGFKKGSHQVLVADIVDEVILGMDLMRKFGFTIDLKNGVLRVDHEEVPIHKEDDGLLRVVLVDDITLPECCEKVVMARIDGSLRENCLGVMEPNYTNMGRGILIGKVLVNAKQPTPVPLINLNSFPTKLKKGTEIGTCAPVAAVAQCVNTAKSDNTLKCPEKLQAMITAACKNLTSNQKDKAKKLICQYQDVFASEKGLVGRSNMVTHKINTGDAQPIKQHPRRLPWVKRDEAEKIISEMASQGVIEPSSSPWTSPVVLVKKKDGSTRFCVDYRQLNNATKKDSYPLPRIDDTLDTLTGAEWFSTLDMKSGYWQVGMDPEHREKTAFSIGSGLWQFTVMPFGLCNAPATFERLMELVLRGLSWKTCLVYLDDVIVIGRTFEEHLKNLEDVFRRLRNANLQLSTKKCHLFQKEVKYLGHLVSENGVTVDPDKIRAVQEWPQPKDKHEIRSFLGLCTYYRRFVRGFADIAKPLTKLTEEQRDFKWDDGCKRAFEDLKQALVTAPVLSYPRREGDFVLDTDASNVGMGAVLSQMQDGHERVIGYFSKVFSKPERNYCVTRRELVAVIKSIEHFHKYLYGQKFLVRTDHAALRWLLQFKSPEGQVARWLERLQEYDFVTEHRAGRKHCNADALSRRPCPEDCRHCSQLEHKHGEQLARRTALVNDDWAPQELRTAQEGDRDLRLIIN